MPVHNSDIANKFKRVADLLAIAGGNRFRIRAYRNASQTIRSLSRNVAHMVERDEDLTQLEGIGEDLAEKIAEMVNTGRLRQLQELEQENPAELVDALRIEGLGPKRIKQLHEELGIKTIEDLKEAAQSGKIQEVEGFGEKIQRKIMEDIEAAGKEERRTKLSVAEEIVKPLIDYLANGEGVVRVTAAGSYRRRKETVGDIDILVVARDGETTMEHFLNYEDVGEVAAKGDTKSTVYLRTGLQVDVRVVPEESYGAALHYFTGSKEHNVAIRERGIKRDLKINEYGVFEGSEGRRVAGASEEAVFKSVDLPYITPELRENRGEIRAAAEGNLPDLIRLEDLRGDLHSHTQATDGHYSLEEMARAAQEKGYDYLAISDHSKRVSMVNGLDARRLEKQIGQIEELNRKFQDFQLLKSIEVDILEDGSLDLPDQILSRLDMVIAAVHSRFNLPEEEQTKRITRAVENPLVSVLAHPTGRMIGEREPYEVDLEKVMEAAKKHHCAMELNASPQRLDLTDYHCKMAKEKGVKVVISTDSHRLDNLDWMRYGIWQARRGWLEAEDVLNTRNWAQIRGLLAPDVKHTG
ncbi:MAG: DNA polymerase/3'-5' exonuclease PolX [Candidatus Bipolaricaulota bacterium]